jgi:pyruvate/2-oxoglutarate dehydrogenase complex dihydrolipoamide dehydrogenase (E3) component
MELVPWDEHNRSLVECIRPAGWQNSVPSGRYNLVAIGGGTAGLVAAIGAASLGGRAALVERHLLGGDCLNYGCVPSKALLRCARACHDARQAHLYGCRPLQAEADFSRIMERMRRLRAGIARHDAAERLRALGVDVYFGVGRFCGPRALEVDGQRLEFHRAVIATGSRPLIPPLAGLEEAGYLTNETVFSLERLPSSLIVLGGGPIGCELGQAFRRFGCEVHVVSRGERLLRREEPEASALVEAQFAREGIHLHLGWQPVRAERMGSARSLTIEREGSRQKLVAEALLVAVGRKANVEGLQCERAGVAYDERGVRVNQRLQTTNPAIYAAGDVCSEHKFTHAADAMARVCLENALFFLRRRATALVIPHCTYTDPEVAQVGLTAALAQQQGIRIDTFYETLDRVDRAYLDGETEGLAMLHVRRGSDRIVGATLVARHAGEMIGEICLALSRRLGLKILSRVIRCYPTQAEVWKRLCDQYQRTRLTPLAALLASRWLAWLRR